MLQLDPDLRALQEVRDLVARAKRAAEAVHGWTQADADRVCRAMARAGADAAFDLARLAVEETGIGRVHYKVLKNLFGTEGVWESIEHEKTVGIVARDARKGVLEVATPAGVIACVVPTTNPTSTALYKALIAVKGRNAVVISPHPRARRCIGESAEVMRRAIERAGGPPDLVCCLSNPTIESTGALMKHPDVALILATGGSGLVRAAYSSGKPAYGVGPGNVPAYVDRTADLALAARSLVASQSFDNGTLCCSEQALVVDRPVVDRLLGELARRGAHLCDERETELLARYCNRGGMMNPDVVGKDPWWVAERAGFAVPRHTSVLLARQGGVGREWPLSIEILCPLLSVHVVDGWEEGCRTCKAILHLGGLGHTMGVYAGDEAVLERFFLEKPASRICANGPTSQGAVGFSTNLVPAMSLGCGPQAGNITSDNITARHLVNVKRVGFPRADWPERERRFHERAAALCGDPAPRGSLLPGDPALAGGRAPASSASAERADRAELLRDDRAESLRDGRAESLRDGGSNWRGNPAFGGSGSTGGGAIAASPAAPVRRTPTFTGRPGTGGAAAHASGASATATERARGAGSGGAPSSVASSRGAASGSGSSGALSSTRGAQQAPFVGSALSSTEIRTMLSSAGTGCPLGPCRGCPHHDVKSGACTA